MEGIDLDWGHFAFSGSGRGLRTRGAVLSHCQHRAVGSPRAFRKAEGDVRGGTLHCFFFCCCLCYFRRPNRCTALQGTLSSVSPTLLFCFSPLHFYLFPFSPPNPTWWMRRELYYLVRVPSLPF